MAKNEVTTTQPGGALATEMPDFMKGVVGAETNIDANDLELPRVQLTQSLSKQVEDGIKPGSFYHNILEESLGDTLADFVPVHVFKSYMLWRPQDDGGGILARAMDAVNWNPPTGEFTVKINKATKEVKWKLAPTVAESKLGDWGTEDPDNPNSPPAATKMINVIGYLLSRPELGLFVLTFQKGTLKVGTKFITKMGMSKVPSFGQVYEISSEKTSNSKNQEFQTFTVKGAGFVKDQETFEWLKAQNEKVSKMNVTIQGDDDLQAEAAQTDGGGDAAVDEATAKRI